MRIEDPDGTVIYPPTLPQGSGPVVPTTSGTVGYYYPPQQGPTPQQSSQSNPTFNIDLAHPEQWGKAINAGVSATYGPIAGAAAGAAVDVGVSAVKKHAQQAIHSIGRMLGIKNGKKMTPEQKKYYKVKGMETWRNLAGTTMNSVQSLVDAANAKGKPVPEKIQKLYQKAQTNYNYWNSRLQSELSDTPQLEYNRNSAPQTPTYERPSTTYDGSQPINTPVIKTIKTDISAMPNVIIHG